MKKTLAAFWKALRSFRRGQNVGPKPKSDVRSFASALALALTLRFLVLSPFVIPSGSMIPTLLVGDYLFVTCFSYGYSKYALPWGRLIPGMSGRVLQFKNPAYGDAVVFRPKYDTSVDYVKRVIALPGDSVQLIQGQVYVNDRPLALKKISSYEKQADEGGRFVRGTLYEETLSNGKKHAILKQEPFGTGDFDETARFTVPQDHYFVMGDNRDGSMDSRSMHTIGFVKRDFLIGQPLMIFFSLDGRARWWQVWKWPTCVRFSRIISFIP